MPRSRRVSPFGVRLIVLGVVATLLIATFAAFVISQQRAADARRAAALAGQRTAETARAQAAAIADTTGTTTPDGTIGADMLDRQAKDTATTALDAANRLAGTGGLNAATTAGLSGAEPDLLFVDGPSTAPSVVSVYVGSAGWAAAVQGGGDSCFWVARTSDGRDRYGTGSTCTGLAALAADQPSW